MLFNGTRNFVIGFALGFGSGFVAREMIPLLGRMGKGFRPAVKASMKGLFLLGERAREGMAHLGESFADLAEEVRVDLTHARQVKGAHAHKVPTKRRKTGVKAASRTHPEPKVVRLEEQRKPA